MAALTNYENSLGILSYTILLMEGFVLPVVVILMDFAGRRNHVSDLYENQLHS